MKKIIVTATLFCCTSLFRFAQDHISHNNLASSSTVDTNGNPNLSQLLTPYYHIKDALAAGNADTVSGGAEAFIKITNSIDYQVISESNIIALLKDAGTIASTKDIKKQQAAFFHRFTSMFATTNEVKLTIDPIYYDYCNGRSTTFCIPLDEQGNQQFTQMGVKKG